MIVPSNLYVREYANVSAYFGVTTVIVSSILGQLVSSLLDYSIY